MNSEIQNTDSQAQPEQKTPKGRMIFTALILVFCIIIFGVGPAIFVSKDRQFSEAENRVLASMPTLSLFSLKEGIFMKEFETYLTDQFVFRDEIISFKSFCDRITGKKEAGNVYIGKDGYLFEKPSVYDEEGVGEISRALETFSAENKDTQITFLLSPNSSFVNSDKLPDYLATEDQNFQIEKIAESCSADNITWINPCEQMKAAAAENQLFYRTDHHWTTKGAYTAFEKLMSHWQKDPTEANFRFMAVADDFQGTLSSKAGVYSSSDIIEICVPQNSALTYTVSYDSTQQKTATLFDKTKLEMKNKYEVFLGGNFDRITIKTTSSSKDTLLLIKDSYANAMIPMLTPYFAQIIVVDPRYSKEKISSVIQEESFTHILFLYNLNTFLQDTSLADALV